MEDTSSMTIAIAWCLAWGNEKTPEFDLPVLQQMQQALSAGEQVPIPLQNLVQQVQKLHCKSDRSSPRIN
jgi:CRISPR-associated protein Cmr2